MSLKRNRKTFKDAATRYSNNPLEQQQFANLTLLFLLFLPKTTLLKSSSRNHLQTTKNSKPPIDSMLLMFNLKQDTCLQFNEMKKVSDFLISISSLAC